mgnify:CR=1 FL=1
MRIGKKKNLYDPDKQTPALRKSICTGETVAGFIDNDTGRFSDYIVINSPSDLQEFCKSVGTEEATLKVIY